MGNSDDFVSPYLQRPLRRYEEALRQRAERRSPAGAPAGCRDAAARRTGEAGSTGDSGRCRDTGGEA